MAEKIVPKQSNQLLTFVWGAVFSLLLVGLPTWLVANEIFSSFFTKAAKSTGGITYYIFLVLPIIVGLMPALVFFAAGVRAPIPIGYVGVRKFLGKRMRRWKLVCEGRSWLFPGLITTTEVDVRKRPLNPDAEKPEDLEIEIDGQMKPKTIAGEKGVEDVPVLGIVRVAAQVQTIDPIAYLDTEESERQLTKTLESLVRIMISDKDPLTLPQEKSDMSEKLREAIKKPAEDYGMILTRLDVTDVRQPKEIEEEAQDFAKERVQRRSKEYQSETWNKAGAKLESGFDGLSAQERLDAVLVGDGRATKNITSIQGLDRAAAAFGTALGGALAGAFGKRDTPTSGKPEPKTKE